MAKDTKVNIPDGWKTDKFSNLVYFQEGPGILSSQFTNSGIKFLNIRCVINDDIRLEECQMIDSKSALGKYKHFLLEADDLVVSSSGTLGRSAFVSKEDLPLMLNTSIIRMRPIATNSLSLLYLKYFVDSYDYQKEVTRLSTGSAQANYGPSHLKKIFITLPKNIKEQEKIAEVMNGLNEAIVKTDQLIEKNKRVKQGLMQDLFLKGIGHKKFKKSEVGFIPDSWKVLKLKNVAKFTNGKAHESFITNEGKYIVVNSKFISVDGDVAKRSNKNLCPLSVGDITMVMSDIPKGKALAKCFLVDKDHTYTLNQRICALTPIEMNNQFLYHILNRNSYFIKFDNGVGQTNLRQAEVLDCPIQIPLQDEQEKIASIIEQADKSITNEEEYRTKLVSIKQGLMHDLLSGKVRVNHLLN